MARKFAGVSGSVASALSSLLAKVTANTIAIGQNATSIAGLGLPLRIDAAQSLTPAQIAQAAANLGGSSSISSAGYKKFADGLIIQWMTATTSNAPQPFPIAFPNACLCASATASTGNTSSNNTVNIISSNASSITLYSRNNGNTFQAVSATVIAIGY